MTQKPALNPLARTLASDANDRSRPPPALLPYQQDWIADDSPLKVAEKSRRIGLTWAEAADDVLIAASENGSNVFYISNTQDMALEYIEACAMWARAYDHAASHVEDGIFEDMDEDGETRHIKTYSITFPKSGHRIVGLSSTPRNLRGKQGVVVIDEGAFADDLGALLKAAMAMLLWGDKVRIISTHDGEENAFNELILEIRAGKRKGSVHRIEFKEAVKQGLYKRVCMRRGMEWTPEGEAQWVADAYKFYGTDADEELDVIPSSGSGVYLTRALIEGVMNSEVPVVRLSRKPEFAELPKHIREADINDWCEEVLKPLLVQRINPNWRSYFGEDFARSANLTVIMPGQERPDLSVTTPFVLELFNMPFEQQKQILFYVVDRLPRFMAGAMDARGNGQYLAEVAMQKYGATRIAQVMLTIDWYRQNMPRFKACFEDKTIELPKDAPILSDMRAVKMVKGVAKLPDSVSKKGEKTGIVRHGDSAIALAMRQFAIAEMEGGEIDYTPAPPRTHVWDGTTEDDDGRDTGHAGGGAW